MAIRCVICDFGGVLTTPLVGSFMAFQDQTGIPTEALGSAMARITERDGAHPLYELEKGHMTEHEFLDAAPGRARGRARPPARAPRLQGDLLQGAQPERRDDRRDAGRPGVGLSHGAPHQQRARVGAALALDASRRRDLRARGRLRLRRHAKARARDLPPDARAHPRARSGRSWETSSSPSASSSTTSR